MRRSPTIEAFRLLFRHPSFGLAEIAWRWSFGAAALLLCIYTLGAYFDSLTVHPADIFLLRTRQPALIGQAIADIFYGSGGRLISGLFILVVALSIMWVLVASLGRAAALRALYEDFRGKSVAGVGGVRALMRLNFLRAAVLWAVLVGSFAAVWLGGLVATKDPLAISTASELSLAVLLLVWGIGYLLNWFLSLASVFAAEGMGAALVSALDFCQARFVGLMAINTWFGFVRLATAALCGTFFLLAVSLTALLPQWLIAFCALVIWLVYCAIADFLCVGKLAAYLYLRNLPDLPSRVQAQLPATPSASIDKDELILSDLPLLPECGA